MIATEKLLVWFSVHSDTGLVTWKKTQGGQGETCSPYTFLPSCSVCYRSAICIANC